MATLFDPLLGRVRSSEVGTEEFIAAARAAVAGQGEALGNLGATPSNTFDDDHIYTATVSENLTDWSGITLAANEGCIILLDNTGGYTVATTGLTAFPSTDGLDDIATDGALLILWNIGGTVYGRTIAP